MGSNRLINRFFCAKIFIFVFLLCTLLISSCGNKKECKVLVLQSYEHDFAAYSSINTSIIKEFKTNNIDAHITTFYLDCERYSAKEEEGVINKYIDSLSKTDNLPDIILVNDDQATYSLLKTFNPAIKSIPIVFFGVNYPNWELLSKYENVAGFWNNPDYLKTAKMAEQLFGKVRMTYMDDETVLGREIKKEMKKQLVGADIKYDNKDASKELRIESSIKPDSLTICEAQVRTLKGESALWLISGFDDYRVFLFTKRDITTLRLGIYSTYPSFTAINEGFGYNQGILAGYIVPIETEIKEAVDLVSKVVRGAPITDFSIYQLDKKHIIDWHVAKRWNINKNNVPPEWSIINISFKERYYTASIILFTIITAILLILFTSMVFLFLRENKRKCKVQRDLDWKNKFLSLTLEVGDIFVWKYDVEKKIFNFDKEFFDYLKLEPVCYSIAQMKEIIHPDDFNQIAIIFENDINLYSEKTTLKLRARFLDETYYWWEFRYSPITIKEEDVMIAGVCMSIQEYKDREAELIQARDLAAKAELKQSFLANMSHEIRTPLNAIVGFSNLLVDDQDSFSKEERGEFIDSINKNCEILLKLINDILEISRIESGSMSFKFEDAYMKELFSDIYTTHMLLMPKNVEFIKEEPKEDIIINTDKVRFIQVITNFINNAVKFTEKGSIRIGYNVCTLKDENTKKQIRELCIYVKDTGKGIPIDQQRIIFDRFYKQDEFAQGTGLGLSICSVIVKRFGGNITIESEIGQGSCFTIHIPFEGMCRIIGEEQDIDYIEEYDDSQVSLDENKKQVILVAEDQESNYLLVKSVLHENYELIRALDGDGALKMMHARKDIALVLMDVRMMGMNGIEATKIISKEFPDIPVIILTAYAFDYDKEKAFNAGCVEFITKPVAPTILKEKVAKFIKK